MYPYIANTKKDQEEMLKTIGFEKLEDLFSHIPSDLLVDKLDLPESKSELEVSRIISNMANKNKTTEELVCFLGAGAYDHYIPSAVSRTIGRAEFYTAYTPYQPEMSQGTLQSVFEYQTMISELAGMDVATISMYDGSTAMAEAAIMAIAKTKRNKVLISGTVHPEAIELVKTYAKYREFEIIEVPEKDGVTDPEALKEMITNEIAGVIVQSPNFFGNIEDVTVAEEAIHGVKGLFIYSADAVSLPILKTPGAWKADIVVGDAQGFGMPMAFGGPYLGYLATTKQLMRRMPGRLVGETVDAEGQRGYVLTLQTREQHIRREKATSNICSDQTLNAITAAVYLSLMGKEGTEDVAMQSLQKSHYLRDKLIETGLFRPIFSEDRPFFKEFALETDLAYEKTQKALIEKGFLYGYSLERVGYDKGVLFCVTEKRTKEEMDQFVKELEAMA